MSTTGLPAAVHYEPHLASDGLCQCSCADCTTRAALFCVCLDCPCDELDPGAPRHGGGGLEP